MIWRKIYHDVFCASCTTDSVVGYGTIGDKHPRFLQWVWDFGPDIII